MSELTDDQADAIARAQALLRDAGLDPTTVTAPGGRTVAQLIAAEAPLLTPGTRRTYRTHFLRFEHGIGPMCDQTCEPCLDASVDFACQCDCKACRDSRITYERACGHDTMPLADLADVGDAYMIGLSTRRYGP